MDDVYPGSYTFCISVISCLYWILWQVNMLLLIISEAFRQWNKTRWHFVIPWFVADNFMSNWLGKICSTSISQHLRRLSYPQRLQYYCLLLKNGVDLHKTCITDSSATPGDISDISLLSAQKMFAKYNSNQRCGCWKVNTDGGKSPNGIRTLECLHLVTILWDIHLSKRIAKLLEIYRSM